MDKRPSETISEFLDFLETSDQEYSAAYADVGREDSKVQTFLHDVEFAQNKIMICWMKGERSGWTRKD